MHIAILVTNTDDSAFAKAHPDDGEKFSLLLQEQRPDWVFSVFSVKDGVFPQDISGFDGFMIGGSPASVLGGADWIDRLESLIREIAAAQIPQFGACFGHQVIAKALGGRLGFNPQGWSFGCVRTDVTHSAAWMTGAPAALNLYSAHKEQVVEVPQGAEIWSVTEGCPVGGFAIGAHVFTTEYHPEMSPEFIAALVEELAGDMPAEVTKQARASLAVEADRGIVAGWIAQFFEGVPKE